MQKNGKNQSADIKKQSELKNKEFSQNKTQELENSKNDPGIRSQITFTSMNVSEWDSDGLNEKDFKSNNSGFTFLTTNKLKKLIYKQEMTDIDIEVDLRFEENSVDNAGIIFGYNKNEKTANENYFLFKVDNSASFSLFKIQNEKKDLLLAGKRSLDLSKKIFRLKIKCLGPWIMLYNDNKLLESFLNSDFIRGRIGLYSESNTQVEFTDLKISSAFEKN